MQRKEFLKKGFAALGFAAIAPSIITSCKKEDVTTTTGTGTAGSCTVSPSETEGPFPTKSPSTLQITDIRSDRTGVPFTIKITIQNKNNACAAISGAIVDIWHCDRDGYYSEYGGTGMQSANFTTVHFLRGRQVTDANGLVTFTSIFPGWYSGRAPHIHVHVYDSSGKSLLVTQIAFPKTVCDTVYTTATNYYTRGVADTLNEKDNVFSDGFTAQLATITGSVAAGYALTHTIAIAV